MKKYFKNLIPCFLLFSCGIQVNSIEDFDRNQNDSLLAVATTRVSVHNEWLGSLSSISNRLDSINEGRLRLSLRTLDKKEIPPVLVGEINQEILKLNVLLGKNKNEILSLNRKLGGSTKLNKALEDTIALLNRRLVNKQMELMDLYDLISELHGNFLILQAGLYTLSTQITIKDFAIANGVAEANTAYYCIGNKESLEKKKILENGNNVFFKRLSLNSEMDTSGFTKIDIRKKKDFVINSKFAKLLSIHSTHSYRLEKYKMNGKKLIITDASEFWRISKFLIIKTD